MGTIQRGHCQRPGFNLVELVIVIAISVILLGLASCGVQNIRDGGSSTTQCVNNLKQIGIAVHNFEATFKRMPPLYGGSDGMSVINSQKFGNVWGSTHVFLLPYIEQDRLYALMQAGTPAVYDPTTSGGPANTKAIPTYSCPMDPSMNDGIVIGSKHAGTSYAANAQVFAPLTDETIAGGAMYPASKPDFTDRGWKISEIQDGSSNTIIFTHSYGLLTIWGYGAGVNQPPTALNTNQPWARASYLNQTYMTPANRPAFQIKPTPYTKCLPTEPATPHSSSMMVLLGDASVRSVVPSIAADTWNKACLPNDGNKMPADW